MQAEIIAGNIVRVKALDGSGRVALIQCQSYLEAEKVLRDYTRCRQALDSI